ncbi:MAG: hypothetical protein SCH12_06680 [Nitrosomonadaceae bacterium]|nr:hypothetical protein [Nitrosomonadaceae bacterium]
MYRKEGSLTSQWVGTGWVGFSGEGGGEKGGGLVAYFPAVIHPSFQSNCLLLAYLSENGKRLPSLRAA